MKVENWKLKFEIVCGNTVQLWPPTVASREYRPTVASHCGLPLWPPTVASHCGRPWEYRSKLLLSICLCFLKGGHGRPQLEAMGIPLTIAFDQFPYVFLWEATGGHGRPREYRNPRYFDTLVLMFSYGRPRPPGDLNSLFFTDVRTPSSVR